MHILGVQITKVLGLASVLSLMAGDHVKDKELRLNRSTTAPWRMVECNPLPFPCEKNTFFSCSFIKTLLIAL